MGFLHYVKSTLFRSDLPPWLSGLAISELQCIESLAGLFEGHGFISLTGMVRRGGQARAPGQFSKAPVPPACRVRLSACKEIKILGRYRGFACVLLKLTGHHSQTVLGCLGVVRAAGVDNRLEGPWHVGTCQRNQPA